MQLAVFELAHSRVVLVRYVLEGTRKLRVVLPVLIDDVQLDLCSREQARDSSRVRGVLRKLPRALHELLRRCGMRVCACLDWGLGFRVQYLFCARLQRVCSTLNSIPHTCHYPVHVILAVVTTCPCLIHDLLDCPQV